MFQCLLPCLQKQVPGLEGLSLALFHPPLAGESRLQTNLMNAGNEKRVIGAVVNANVFDS